MSLLTSRLAKRYDYVTGNDHKLDNQRITRRWFDAR